ncbi:MAG: M14 family metallopeptidase [Ardenticatenaceae bacterium]
MSTASLRRSLLVIFLPLVLLLFMVSLSAGAATTQAAHAPEVAAPGGTGDGQAAPEAAPEVQDIEAYDVWVVRAYYDDRQMVNDLASWKEPWEVHHNQGYLVIDVTREEYDRLLAAGFRLEVDEELTALINREPLPLPPTGDGIPGYECYRTVEGTYATGEQIAADYPQLATWTDIGDSWEKTQNPDLGYDLMVLKLTNSAIPGPKPAFFAMSAIHAREYTTAELNTRFAEHLVQNYGIDPDITWILDHHEVHLLLQANPDGRKKAETGLLWRKNTNNNYCSDTNQRGADLNRNFEFQWGCCGGSSGSECSEVYRGASPASEPETQAVQEYVRSIFPDQREDDITAAAPITATGVFMDLHSYSELVLWPWGFTDEPTGNGTQFQTFGRKFAYFNDYFPEQSIGLYPTDGTTIDFAYGDLGVGAFTFELGTAFFQQCSTFENVIYPDNLPALVYAAKTARTPYLTPAGPDTLDVFASPATVEPGVPVALSAQADDTRFNNQNGTEPTQPIVAAEYYIDVPPWSEEPAPVAYPMEAADGTFDSPVEEVIATVDTTGLTVGRHTLYVRSQDDADNWGVVSAVFIEVTEPPTAVTITTLDVTLARARVPTILSALILAGLTGALIVRRRRA